MERASSESESAPESPGFDYQNLFGYMSQRVALDYKEWCNEIGDNLPNSEQYDRLREIFNIIAEESKKFLDNNSQDHSGYEKVEAVRRSAMACIKLTDNIIRRGGQLQELHVSLITTAEALFKHIEQGRLHIYEEVTSFYNYLQSCKLNDSSSPSRIILSSLTSVQSRCTSLARISSELLSDKKAVEGIRATTEARIKAAETCINLINQSGSAEELKSNLPAIYQKGPDDQSLIDHIYSLCSKDHPTDERKE